VPEASTITGDMSECSQISCRGLCGKITACAQLEPRLERSDNGDDIASLHRLRQEDRVGVVEPLSGNEPTPVAATLPDIVTFCPTYFA